MNSPIDNSNDVSSQKEAPQKAWWHLWFKILSWSYLSIVLLILGFFIYFSYPFVHTLYTITKIPETYFSIEVKGSDALYSSSLQRPKDWVPLNEISRYLKGAIISSEDGKFYQHPGYDIEELRDAINDGVVKQKKKVRGASTITQQLVKNLFFQTDRSLWRKSKELILTLWLEEHVSKDKILESYLNIIEYGKGIYGISAASRHYFNKKPKQLTPRESAFLAMLLPSPVRYSQSFKKKTLTPFAQRMVHSILFKMLQGGYIGIEQYYDGLGQRMSWEKVNEAESENLSLGDL
jgi:monofunctional biosynthetic peptidoglycan transglycosylase